MLAISLPMLVTSLSGIVMKYTDVLMIGSYLSTSDVGIYMAALRLSMVIAIPLSIFGGVISPEIARLKKLSDHEGLSRTLKMFSAMIVTTVSDTHLTLSTTPYVYSHVYALSLKNKSEHLGNIGI